MERKLVKQGAATLMISLPSKWVQQHGLKKGDPIGVLEEKDKLILSPRSAAVRSETSIKLSGLTESFIRTLITNSYREGFDKISVEFTDENQFKILESIVRSRLIGFEIVKKSGKVCIVENITEPSEKYFDSIIEKMFLDIEELFNVTIKRLSNAEQHELESYEEMEQRIQKYDNFCRRIAIKHSIPRSDSWVSFLTLVSHAQREIYFANKLLNSKIKLCKESINLLNETKHMFSLIYNSYKSKDKKSLEEIHSEEKQLIYKRGYTLLEKTNGKETVFVYHLLGSIRNFYQSNSPLMGLM